MRVCVSTVQDTGRLWCPGCFSRGASSGASPGQGPGARLPVPQDTCGVASPSQTRLVSGSAAHHWGEERPPQYPSSPSVSITGVEQLSLRWTLGSQEASSPGDVCFSLCRLHTAEQDTILRPAASPPYRVSTIQGVIPGVFKCLSGLSNPGARSSSVCSIHGSCSQ